jgi:hypothetical protein
LSEEIIGLISMYRLAFKFFVSLVLQIEILDNDL